MRRMISVLGAALVFDVAAACGQPVATMVADLNATLDDASSTSILAKTSGAGHVWFFARTRGGAYTLYVSDDASETPRPVHVAAFTGSADGWNGKTLEWATLGDRLFYAIPRTPTGAATDIYVADATTGSVVPIPHALCTPACSSPVGFFAPLDGGRMLFTASNGASFGLFVSDGTASGTSLIAPSAPLDASLAGSPVVGAGKVYFRVKSATTEQLWVSDGTGAGTYPYYGRASASSTTNVGTGSLVGSKLFFWDADHGVGVSDGTPGGTTLITPRLDGAGSPFALPADAGAVFGGYQVTGYLTSVTRLWRTDFTGAGTAPIFGAAVDPAEPVDCTILGRVGAVWVLKGRVGTTRSLYVTDATAAGTRRIEGTSVLNIWPDSVVQLDAQRVVFSTDTGLYVTDGTSAGTFQLSTVRPEEISRVSAGSGLLLFANYDGIWRTDGTVSGTFPLLTQRPGINIDAEFTTPSISRLANGRFILHVVYGQGQSVIPVVSDGTVAGTVVLGGPFSNIRAAELSPVNSHRQLVFGAGGSRAVFLGRDSVHGQEVWSSDGTPEHTAMALDVAANVTLGSSPKNFRTLGDRLLFTGPGVWQSASVGELFSTDGTAGGTLSLGGVGLDALSRAIPIAGGRLCLYYSQEVQAIAADGMSTSTVLTLSPDDQTVIDELAPVGAGQRLVVRVDSLAQGGTGRLFACDSMTGALAPLYTPLVQGSASGLTATGGRVYFADQGAILSTDGNTVVRHTNLVPNIPADQRTDSPWQFLAFGSSLAFVDAGVRVRAFDLDAGAGGSAGPIRTLVDAGAAPPFGVVTLFPCGRGIAAVGGHPFYTGANFYVSDGTVSGTRLCAPLWLSYYSTPRQPPFVSLASSVIYYSCPAEYASADLTLVNALTGASDLLYHPPSELLFPPPPLTLRGRAMAFVREPDAAVFKAFGPGPGPGVAVMPRVLIPWYALGASIELAGVHRGRAYVVQTPPGELPQVWSCTTNVAGARQVASIPAGVQITQHVYGFAGNRMYFAASDAVHGEELWSVPLPPACPADLDGDERVTLADVFAMIGAFFAGDPGASSDGQSEPVVGDIFRFLGDWFAGCP